MTSQIHKSHILQLLSLRPPQKNGSTKNLFYTVYSLLPSNTLQIQLITSPPTNYETLCRPKPIYNLYTKFPSNKISKLYFINRELTLFLTLARNCTKLWYNAHAQGFGGVTCTVLPHKETVAATRSLLNENCSDVLRYSCSSSVRLFCCRLHERVAGAAVCSRGFPETVLDLQRFQ